MKHIFEAEKLQVLNLPVLDDDTRKILLEYLRKKLLIVLALGILLGYMLGLTAMRGAL